MTDLYPEIEPYDAGMLDVGDGDSIYWETCGNPLGKPAVVLHGGPGSGCDAYFRQLFDPDAYRIVLFDQRNCGRSTPHASDPDVDLANNTTASLVSDIEAVRQHLNIGRWLVLGGSWGSTLALAYSEEYRSSVSEVVLFGVTTGRHSEFDWAFRGGLSLFFPEQWQRLCSSVSTDRGDVIDSLHHLLNDPSVSVRERAAEAWCLWESATAVWPPKEQLAPRFQDPSYAMAFSRIVNHYVRHNAWLPDGILLRRATALAGLDGVLINGGFDFQAPIANAWALRESWSGAELIVVDDAGHGLISGMSEEVVRATGRFATRE